MRMTVVVVLVTMGTGTRVDMVMSGLGVVVMMVVVTVLMMFPGTMRMVVLTLYRGDLWLVFMLIGHEMPRFDADLDHTKRHVRRMVLGLHHYTAMSCYCNTSQVSETGLSK